MLKAISDIKMWPTKNNGELVIENTHEALYLAHLISEDLDVIRKISRARDKAYLCLRVEKAKLRPDFQKMMDLAMKAQFCRECLEEVTRIRRGYPTRLDYDHFVLTGQPRIKMGGKRE